MLPQASFVMTSEVFEWGRADAVKIDASKIDILILRSRAPMLGEGVLQTAADHPAHICITLAATFIEENVERLVLRLCEIDIADGDTTLAAAILEQVQPESPDDTVATVAGCIGVALGLLDDWLTGTDDQLPL